MIDAGHDPDTRIHVDVRRARQHRGWSQQRLAAVAGVSRPTIARFEAGKTISLATLNKLITALDLEIQVDGPGCTVQRSPNGILGGT